MTANEFDRFLALIRSFADPTDRRVNTPRGAGMLWGCLVSNIGVALDSDQEHIAFFSVTDVEPERSLK